VQPGSGDSEELRAAIGDRPNLVVIMTDDQTMQSLSVMPNVQRLLVDQGMSFPNSFVTYPLCCPSRASFFTAQYSHNNGVEWNSGPNGGYGAFKEQQTTVPAALQAAGYRTSHIGKFLNGYGDQRTAAIPKGFDNFQGLVGPSTGQYFGFTINNNGVMQSDFDNRYQTDVLTELAVADIAAAKADGRPFFLNLAYLAPHAEFGCPLASCSAAQIREEREFSNIGFGHSEAVPAPRHEGAFASTALPRPTSFGNLTKNGSIADARPPLSDLDIADITSGYRSELESLLAVDEGVARVVDALEAAGVLDKTLIAFTSDNGFFHGEHRLRYGKYLPYEESLKVPLVVRGPAVAPGTSNATVVTNVDLSTTLMGYTGTSPLREADGLDLSPLFADPALTWDRAALVEGLGPQAAGQPQYLGIRTKRWAFFEFADSPGAPGGVELYDLEADPFQVTNLADDPAHATTRAQLGALVAELTLCAGLACGEAVDPTR
jgi:arylsulfatase A-like enzyme